MLSSLEESSGSGLEFFSSPLFGAQSHNSPSSEHAFDSELMLLPHAAIGASSSLKDEQMSGSVPSHLLLADPFDTPEPAHFHHMSINYDMDGNMGSLGGLNVLHHLDHRVHLSGRASSGASSTDGASSSASSESDSRSGHSTPTLVSTSPTQVHTHLRVPSGSVAAPLARASSGPSLLDQLSCTIQESSSDSSSASAASLPMFSAVHAPAIKVKKERKMKKEVLASPRVVPQTQPLAPFPMMHTLSVPHSSAAFARPTDVLPPSPMLTSSPRSSSSTAGGDSDEPAPGDSEETRKAKLARKASLARLARKRKKTRLSDLEAEVRRLEEELAQARALKKSKVEYAEAAAHEAALAQARADEVAHEKMAHVVQAMSHAVQSGLAAQVAAQQHAWNASVSASSSTRGPVLTGSDATQSATHPTALTPLIDAFMLQYTALANNCQKHLQALHEHHVKPLRTFDFLAALMAQPHDSTSSSPWSSLLCTELSLSPSSRELAELDSFRLSLAAQHKAFDLDIARALAKTQSLFVKRANQQAKNLSRIRAIFSEEQFVRYVEWAHRQVDAHQASDVAAAGVQQQQH